MEEFRSEKTVKTGKVSPATRSYLLGKRLCDMKAIILNPSRSHVSGDRTLAKTVAPPKIAIKVIQESTIDACFSNMLML